MTNYEFPGEPLETVMPADVKSVEFQGVVAYLVVGTEDQLRKTTGMLSEIYAGPMVTLGDARWIGKGMVGATIIGKGDPHEDVYMLVVLRKV